MALPALASIEELAERLGSSIGDLESGRAYGALNDASTLVRAEVGLSWVDDAGDLTTVPAIAEMVTLSVAQRIYTNPRGLISRSIGSYREQWSSGGQPAPAAALTAYERTQLARLRGHGGLRTIQVHRPGISADYVPVANGDPPGSWLP